MLLTILAAPMNPLWSYLALLGLIVVVVLLLGIFGIIMGRLSATSSRKGGTVGNALLRMEASVLPGREHVVEAIERDDVEEDDQGDPPGTGKA